MTRVYLSGPMRGYPNFNFAAFRAAAAVLRAEGLEVFCPAESSDELAAQTGRALRDITFEEYMNDIDIPAILRCDQVVVLDGWERSTGSRIEVLVAVTCGKGVYDFDTREDVVVDMSAALNALVNEASCCL